MLHLKEYRKKAKLTQEQLAAKVGLTASAIKKFEAGRRSPRTINAMKLAKVLKTTVEKLHGKLEEGKS